jgi:hypothetical protein
MASVDVMIVGSQKSGTSSLLAYLGAHPGILPQQRREMTWFTDADLAAHPFPHAFYFDDGPGQLRLGKLSGLMYDTTAVTRLVENNPDVIAVAVLREPVARAYASYWFARRRGRESQPSFEEAIEAGLARIGGETGWEDSGCPYLDWSCYAPHLERLRRQVGSESLHVLVLEDLVRDPRVEVAPLLRRLGLDADGLDAAVPWENSAGAARSTVLARARRRGGRISVAKRVLSPSLREALRRHYRRFNETEVSLPPIDPVTRERLRTVFEGPNRRLEDLLGTTLAAWRPAP